MQTENEKISYAVGLQIADNFKSQGLDAFIDTKSFVAGVEDLFTGQIKMSGEEINQVLSALQAKLQAEQMKAQEGAAKENAEKGQKFLEENGKRAEVTTTESGLQYEVLVEGNGPVPTAANTIKAHYTGTTIDGEKFDSSVDRGEPFEASAGGGLIQGWLEALQMMPVGSKWKLFIPSNLAYGMNGAGPQIGPNSTLIFELELLEIVG